MGGVRRCCAVNCNNNTRDHPEVKLFNFPTNVERCQKWIFNTSRGDLKKKPTSQVVRSHFLCSQHFDDNQFMNTTKKQLVFNAVPTVFIKPNHINSQKTIAMKRPPPKEREPYQIKKRKLRLIAPVPDVDEDGGKTSELSEKITLFAKDESTSAASKSSVFLTGTTTVVERNVQDRNIKDRVKELEEELKKTKEALSKANETIKQLMNQTYICGTLTVDML